MASSVKFTEKANKDVKEIRKTLHINKHKLSLFTLKKHVEKQTRTRRVASGKALKRMFTF